MRLLILATYFGIIAHSTVYSLIPELLNRDRTRTLPVQMDMISKNTITICTGNKRTLGCREGANIAITDVFWGRLSDQVCPSDDGDPVTDCDAAPDSLGLVRDECEGKKECDLTAKHNKLQKKGSSHCPGVNKYLVVKFSCMPESKGILLCDSAETELSCEAGWVMQLADVFWGRRSNSRTCGLSEGLECDSSEGVSSFLKKKCNGKRKCLVKNNVDVLDPNKKSACGEAEKYLLLNYICTPPKDAKQRVTEILSDESKSVKFSDESKSVKETSSKELMGLLENQIKGNPSVAASNNAITPTEKAKKIAMAAEVKSKLVEEDESLEKKSVASTSQQVKESPSNVDGAGIDTSSVSSILSRAKNILKTLDLDSSRKKRFKITRPTKLSAAKSKQQPQQQQRKRGFLPRPNMPQRPVYYPDNFILKNWYKY